MLADQTKHHKAHAEEGHAAPVIDLEDQDSSEGKVMRGSSH
jgi:hypothetical protein